MDHMRSCNAVGIDLGTTFSSLAFLDAQGVPRMVADSSGQTVVPSVVFFDDQEVIVGDLAVQHAKLAANRIAQFVKLHMGDEWQLELGGHQHTPESISAIVLRHLIREAEPQIGPIRKAVITVPAYFTERRRRATEDAGKIAGLEVIGTLNEPMAATLAFGSHQTRQEESILVYDLGGGTFDVTIVRITPGEIEELATSGNRRLGGRDWDQCLIDYVSEDFFGAHGIDPRDDLQSCQDLQVECELAKRRLTRMSKASVRIHASGRDHTTEFSREEFEERTLSLLQTTKLTAEVALEDAGLRWDQLTRVLLVGGSTHMPAVRRMLEQAAGYPPDTGINPVTAVALGAAIYADTLELGTEYRTIRRAVAEEEGGQSEAPPASEGKPASAFRAILPSQERRVDPLDEEADRHHAADPIPADKIETEHRDQIEATSDVETIRFVTAHGVGVKTYSGDDWRNTVLIPRNTSVPAIANKRFVTASNTGSGRYINVVITQGDSVDINAVEIMASGQITGFPEEEEAGQPVDVKLEFNKHGRLRVHAVYVNSGVELKLALDVQGGLKPEEVLAHRDYLEGTNLGDFDSDSALAGLDDHDVDDEQLNL